MPEWLRLLPVEASTFAPDVDSLFLVLTAFSAILCLVLFGLILHFAVHYRRGNDVDRSGRIRRSLPYELAWSVVPMFIALALFGWGGTLYLQRTSAPADALEIQGIAKQWMWKFQHAGGQEEINELHIPLGRAIKLRLASQDVIHSFYVPAFRVKQDVVPGRYSTVWFEATEPGEFHLFCAEFCGTAHATMNGRVIVSKPAAFSAWLTDQGGTETPAAGGERLFRSYGCSGCHGENAQIRAPNLAGLFGKPVPLAGGGTTTADDAYIRDSILMPDKQVVAGYEPIMPSFDGLVSEEHILSLIAFIRSLADEASGAP